MADQRVAVDRRDIKVHFLDVGPQQYGDALLCEFSGRTVLIDGAHPGNDRGQEGHPSIPDQIGQLLRSAPPYQLDLLVVSHAHDDHIGCLPSLIETGTVAFEWALVADPDLGWGRAHGEDRDADIGDNRLRMVVDTLRDECGPSSRGLDDLAIRRLMEDAHSLEDRYRGMLSTLRQRGTHVVRLGQDRVDQLQVAFSDIGLIVVGPSRDQLFECAELINRLSRDAATRLQDLFQRDARLTPMEVYRQLTQGTLDVLDVSRPGAAVNCQSVTTMFQVQGQKFLFAGDMQFQAPGVQSDVINETMAALRRTIQQNAPYDLVKLSHHGSDNAFSEQILRELGDTVLFGICAGEHSEHHPNPSTLRVLNAHRETIRWARTDRNGLVTMTFGSGAPRVTLTQGRLNDPQPNTVDVPEPVPPTTEVTPIVQNAPLRPRGGESPVGHELDIVQVWASIPHVSTRVSITVEVTPSSDTTLTRSNSPSMSTRTPAGAPASPPMISEPQRHLGDGRRLPSLLFVTNAETLAANIGREESAQVLAMLHAQGFPLLSDIPRSDQSVVVADAVRRKLRTLSSVQGVVLIGGHDVVPHQKLDCLPAELRARLQDTDDPDHFVVWSDDVYGDVDGDGLPELPVSRIPDGKSAILVRAALESPTPIYRERAGIRNVARPFADGVFLAIRGTSPLLISQPTVFDQRPPISLAAEQLYFMLHGDYVDSSRFWGENTSANQEAVNIGNLPATLRGIVFTGCCWGALTTETPAGLVEVGRPFGQKTPESSIALSALARGAMAFVGCTGAHYSPDQAPYGYYGAPMHTAFWKHFTSGQSPAEALFNAKIDYLAAMPHGRQGHTHLAIEFKILRQYTCIGLGW